jgi:hypothetical protein
VTSLIALAWEWVGAWGGFSSSIAKLAAFAGLAGGRFGELREQVDAKPRVVFFGALFTTSRKTRINSAAWPSVARLHVLNSVLTLGSGWQVKTCPQMRPAADADSCRVSNSSASTKPKIRSNPPAVAAESVE